MGRAEIDHLVVAATDLEAGAAWLEARLGVPLAAGGRHEAMGTHNRLLRLGPKRYLELIAIDPCAPVPGRPRWFGLDDPVLREKLAGRPRLLHWVARCDDIAACAGPAAEILDMARGDFRWRITVPADGHLQGDGLIPSPIEWLSPLHPAERLPEQGCALMKLEGFHPDPGSIRSVLAALGVDDALALYPAESGETPSLVAYLKTPQGLVEID